MNEQELLADRFETHRSHLKAVAYRMLGSVSEADDAVQEAWLRLSRADTSDVTNLAGWLTTVVSRVCLDMLRSRTTRREVPFEPHLPDPVVRGFDGDDPEYEVLMADSVGLALLVVLEALRPAERLAFVLHDMFAMPFEEIGPILDRSPSAAKQLASRARRRVQGAPVPDPDLVRQRQVVDAFLTAARGGDLAALVAVLHPDVVLRADRGPVPAGGFSEFRGAAAVAGQAMLFRDTSHTQHRVRVNGGIGILSTAAGVPRSLLCFTVADGRIVAIDVLADPERLRRIQPPAA